MRRRITLPDTARSLHENPRKRNLIPMPTHSFRIARVAYIVLEIEVLPTRTAPEHHASSLIPVLTRAAELAPNQIGTPISRE